MDLQHRDCLNGLQDRCAVLFRSMGYDPERPFWQMEYCSLLFELTSLIALLDNRLSAMHLDYADVTKRVTSLEHRYSELLYQLKENK